VFVRLASYKMLYLCTLLNTTSGGERRELSEFRERWEPALWVTIVGRNPDDFACGEAADVRLRSQANGNFSLSPQGAQANNESSVVVSGAAGASGFRPFGM
jgi:hypothetical protein